MIVLGADMHKSSHTLAAVAAITGELLGAAESTAFQSRVSDDCGRGSAIRSIAADGGVTCEVDDSGSTTYSAGNGLSLTGTTFSINSAQTQRRLVQECAVGSSIRSIAEDGTVTCEQDAGHGWTIRTNSFSELPDGKVGILRAFCPPGHFSNGRWCRRRA